ncbi:PaaI family thioesterase [Bacillus thermotolerans]|uniref:PaaI family thioesterase n=1 Tax=Bacillus thermotolerans TaxID=1221996 RepID=UPI00057FBD79|nr:PaaI family thioesterase [Bacillus thermotolerans]KKB39228.1 hypothetical protein QY97_00130 [Bacillus thermotolerans]KKB41984.1 hypothetical protein QY96_01779 [Bacillus thermotolerans]
MTERIYSLLEQTLKQSSPEDLKVLEQLLEGHLEKVKGKGTYIGRLLQLDRKINEEEYRCEVRLPITGLSSNSLQIVHGGVTATVLDSAMGSAAYTAVPKGTPLVTSNLNIHYIAPGKGEELTVKAQVVHKGSKTVVVEGEVVRDDGKKVAHATGSFFVLEKK